MAKKTSYLTELIERHERWKAEGGGRAEEDELPGAGEEAKISQRSSIKEKDQSETCDAEAREEPGPV